MAAAFYLRLYLDNTGLATCALARHDEMNYVPRVVAFLNNDFGMDYFINPTLYMYVLYAATVVTGWFSVLFGHYESFEAFRLEVTFNPHLIVLVGRILSIVVSTLSVGLVYVVARRMFSFRIGLVSAAALALNVTHARRAVLVGNETLMVFLVLLFFLALLRYLRAPGTRGHALCGLLLGLAGSVKYNAFIQGVPLAAATFMAWRNRKDSLARPEYIVGFFVMVAAFFLGSPFIALNFKAFLYDFTHQYAYLHEGFTSFDRFSMEVGYLYYVKNFPALNNGLAYGIACGLGIVAAAVKRDEKMILLLCAVLPLYLFLGMGTFSRMRFLLPAIPFVLILGAWFLSWAVNLLKVQRRDAIYFVLCAATLVPAAVQVHASLDDQYGKTDPRGEIVQWIMEHHEPEARTLEYTHNSYSDFPYSRKALDVYGYEEGWFTTDGEKEAWQRFEAGLYDFTPFVNLLKRAGNLEALKRLIAEEGYRYLLVAMPVEHITSIAAFPEKAPHLTGGFGEWDALLGYMAGLTLKEKITDEEYRLTMLLYELP